jgi:NhaA family Na+:H+ antiporter
MPDISMRKFFSQTWAPGLFLTAATLIALGVANSSLLGWYRHFLDTPLGLEALHLRKPWLLWVNDGLMAVFFFQVGLEIKREILVGELSTVKRLALPLIAAMGGMIVPAAIYAGINAHDAIGLRGWAIPAATDIAFALGVLSLMGSRVPGGLKVFLAAAAIIDDLGAILIIAFFYTAALSLPMLGGAAACIGLLIALNAFGARIASPYLLAGALLWFCVLKSGVHPTLAGVATALAIPESLIRRLEHGIKPWVDFGILPVFAFCNAGLVFAGISLHSLAQPITLGVALGLIAGKAIGIFSSSLLVVRIGWAEFPAQVSRRQLFGVACLCGIGFTMSLFIGTLAFGDEGGNLNLVKLGVMSGSAVSAILGSAILGAALRRDAMGPAR